MYLLNKLLLLLLYIVTEICDPVRAADRRKQPVSDVISSRVAASLLRQSINKMNIPNNVDFDDDEDSWKLVNFSSLVSNYEERSV